MNSDSLLPALEAISRDRPDRVLRLRGTVQSSEGAEEVLEVLIFRGFSSCTTHSTDFDPDQSVLPDGAALETAELLRRSTQSSAGGTAARAAPCRCADGSRGLGLNEPGSHQLHLPPSALNP